MRGYVPGRHTERGRTADRPWRALGLAVVGLLIVACATPSSSVAPSAGANAPSVGPSAPAELTEVTVVLPSEMTSQNPYSDATLDTWAFWGGVYDTLVESDGTNYFGELAESWENVDPLTWRFHLNPEAKFADGTKVTSDDVAFSFDRMKNDPGSVQAGNVEDLAEVIVVDDETFDMTTGFPVVAEGILQVVGNRTIQSKAYFERVGIQEGDQNPNGSGAYDIVEWRPGERYVLELRDDYWGLNGNMTLTNSVLEGKAPDRVIYRFISEPEAQVTALLNGEIDVVGNLPLQFVSRIKDSSVATVYDLPYLRHFFFVLNPISEPLQNIDVRRAINHAIDVQGIIDGPVQGDAIRLEAPILPASLEVPGIATYPYDPARAREMLSAAGYPDGFEIKLKCPSGQFLAEREICEAAATMLREVGLTVDLANVEWSTFSTDYRSAGDGELGYEMFYIGATPPSVSNVSQYDSWFECSDRVAYCENTENGQEFADLYRVAKGTLDDDARAAKFREAFMVLMDDPPLVPLFLYNNHYGVSNRVTYAPPAANSVEIKDIYVNP